MPVINRIYCFSNLSLPQVSFLYIHAYIRAILACREEFNACTHTHTPAHYTYYPPAMLAYWTLACQRKTHCLFFFFASGSSAYVMPQERALSSHWFVTHPPAMSEVAGGTFWKVLLAAIVSCSVAIFLLESPISPHRSHKKAKHKFNSFAAHNFVNESAGDNF